MGLFDTKPVSRHGPLARGEQHARHSSIHHLLPRSPPTRRPTRLFHPFGFRHSRTPLISRAVAGQAPNSGTLSIAPPGPPVQHPCARYPGPLLNLTTPRFGQPLRPIPLKNKAALTRRGVTRAFSFCEHLEATVCFTVASRRARCNPLCPSTLEP